MWSWWTFFAGVGAGVAATLVIEVVAFAIIFTAMSAAARRYQGPHDHFYRDGPVSPE